MQIDGPVLLYGAGREARSTADFLARRYPGLELFVTSDDGMAELEGATAIPAGEAANVTRFGTIVKSPGVSLYKPVFDAAQAGVNHLNQHWPRISAKGAPSPPSRAPRANPPPPPSSI